MTGWKVLLWVLLAVLLAGLAALLVAGWALGQAVGNIGTAYYVEAKQQRLESVKKDMEWARKNPNPQKVRVWGGALV